MVGNFTPLAGNGVKWWEISRQWRENFWRTHFTPSYFPPDFSVIKILQDTIFNLYKKKSN